MSRQGKVPMISPPSQVHHRTQSYGNPARRSPVLSGCTWTNNAARLTSLKFKYRFEDNHIEDGPLYGAVHDDQGGTVDFQRLRRMTGFYVNGIIKSVKFHDDATNLQTGKKELRLTRAGPDGKEGTPFDTNLDGEGDIVEIFGTCKGNSILSIGVFKKRPT